jgi:hypothetical protein
MKSQVVTPQPINAVNAIAKNRIGLNSESNDFIFKATIAYKYF